MRSRGSVAQWGKIAEGPMWPEELRPTKAAETTMQKRAVIDFMATMLAARLSIGSTWFGD
jgi:hypothetical protein